MHSLETSGNKNNLRTIWGWNRQKIKNNPGSAESYWFLLKKACSHTQSDNILISNEENAEIDCIQTSNEQSLYSSSADNRVTPPQ